MKAKDKRLHKKADEDVSSKREKLSLFPLSIEDALRAAAKTGRPPPLESQKPKRRQRKKRTKPA
jgi:hypothetical protein